MRLFGSLILGLICIACSPAKEEKPPIEDCTTNCANATPGGNSGGNSGTGGTAGSGGSGGSTGSSGKGGTGGTTSSVGVKIQGFVVLHNESTFKNPILYSQTALITANPADVSLPPADNWLGSGEFSLYQVATGASWLKATPTALSESTLGGLLQITLDPSNNPSITVPVVDTALMATILGTLPGSPVLDQNAAHVLITFVDGNGTPTAGVQVKPSFAAIQAYDSGPEFSGTATGNRGQALLLNAQLTPGASVTYTANGGKTGTIPLLLEQRIVTFASAIFQLSCRDAHHTSPCPLGLNSDMSPQPLYQFRDMRNQSNLASSPLERIQRSQRNLQGVHIERSKSFVDEQRFDTSLARA